MATKKKPAASAVEEPKFDKVALMTCKQFRDRCDLVSAILQDGVKYTKEEAEVKIADYMKGKVK